MEGSSSPFPLQALPWRGPALPPPAAPALAFVCSLCLLLHREQCGGPLCLLLPLSLLSSHMRVPYRLLCLAAAKLVSRWRDKRHAGDLNGNGVEKPLLDRRQCVSGPGSWWRWRHPRCSPRSTSSSQPPRRARGGFKVVAGHGLVCHRGATAARGGGKGAAAGVRWEEKQERGGHSGVHVAVN
ncbi:hypothetical protein EJB05_28231 [Eragrostis curvula]|uniref:Uncharacterized protein n=1 Tax=Eragrostis curvula TaxID=38414 RepID=A0A5J9UQ84_9POAL|nr:hypothetical protein EJB05_28231 [Eragrostis curvula]